MRNWPGGDLHLIEGGEHEVLMETPQARAMILDRIAERFSAAA
jgi:lysophospholipase